MRQYRGLPVDVKAWVAVQEGDWVYGYLCAPDQIIVWDEEKAVGKCIQVDSKTVGQSTDLKDKNGKEIYVGHKYKWYQPLVEEGKQIYREHISIVIDDIVELYYLSNRIDSTMGVEIIGNIHQPELLEKPK